MWEGLPFNVTMSGPLNHSYLNPAFGLLSITNIHDRCMYERELTTIAGVKALQIAPGIGLVPRATGTVSYTFDYSGGTETLTGTIGLPETKGEVSAGVTITNPVIGVDGSDRYWCLPPRMEEVDDFYRASSPRTATISGTWVLVADGSQTSDTITLDPMWAGSFSAVPSGDRNQLILPSTIDLRISNLECNVATPTAINFAAVQRDITKDAELAKMNHPFNVHCSQDTDKINANISVQFRAKSELYDAFPSRLSLRQGGGYITGEISGVTTDGSCGGTGGITFDRVKIPLGDIKDTETSKVFPNQIVWRLCSGGTNLPSGPVDAVAEMLVTYN